MSGELDHVSESTAPEAPPLPLGFVQVDQQQMATAVRQDLWPVAGHRGSTPVLEACLADFGEATATGDTAGIPTLVKIVADLALIERGAIRPGSRRAQQALRIGRLSLARRLITRHLSKTTLSPNMVADLLGVSVRYLHVLFEATGASFSQTVTAQRMSECRRLLCEQPPRPIAEIALACGFGSLATFYRVFSTSEGVTPGEFRARGGTIALAETPPPEPAV